MRAIQDEFSERSDVSRQRRWQLRKVRSGLCQICGFPAVTAFHCEQHRRAANLVQRERQRSVFGRTKRYLGAESYSYEEGLAFVRQQPDCGAIGPASQARKAA
jgi:hypothetical protein